MSSNIKEHHDKILELYVTGLYGYKKLAKMFNCSKSAIEYLIKSRTQDGTWANKSHNKLKLKKVKMINKVIKPKMKNNPKTPEVIQKYAKMKKNEIKNYWAKNILYTTSKDVILPVGLKNG